ncbi:MAG: M23 family metallopeptidase [Chitinophagales bacterium]
MAKKNITQRSTNLKSKFRFVILNDETFEEKFSLVLTRTNVWVFFSIVAFSLVFLTAAAIVYTPLKYFIPGFGDYNYRGDILKLQVKTDSLANELQARQLWLENLMNVAEGNIDSVRPPKQAPGNIDKSKIDLHQVADAEKELRKTVEEEENFSLSMEARKNNEAVGEVKQMHLIAPVTGYVTDKYDVAKEHFGIDIASKADEPVKAVFDGRVVSATYTLETGYVIAVQHTGNLVSLYKHNSRITKKAGDSVKGGDVIGFVGNTGENSTGPHLHFELWHDGHSLNPADYIVF